MSHIKRRGYAISDLPKGAQGHPVSIFEETIEITEEQLDAVRQLYESGGNNAHFIMDPWGNIHGYDDGSSIK